MKQTLKEVQDLCNYTRERAEDLASVLIDEIEDGKDISEIMTTINMLKDFQFNWGKYDALYGVMIDNKAKTIEEGRLLK